MTGPTLSLAGLFPPIPTPFETEGDVARAAMRANLERWERWPMRGYVVGGSNGEFVLLSLEERLSVVELVRGATDSSRLVIGGAGAESTRETIQLAKAMADRGADAVLVVSPSYYKSQMTAAAYLDHYTRVADASPVPVILYNVPANTGINIPLEAVVELAQHPNIAGMKDSGGDIVRMAEVLRQVTGTFQVLAGSASFFLPALSIGAVGAVSALANIAAPPLASLMEAFWAGNLVEARALQHRLMAPNRAVTAQFGVPGLKAAMEMVGFYGGPTRGPLIPLSSDERSTLEHILDQAGLLPAN